MVDTKYSEQEAAKKNRQAGKARFIQQFVALWGSIAGSAVVHGRVRSGDPFKRKNAVKYEVRAQSYE